MQEKKDSNIFLLPKALDNCCWLGYFFWFVQLFRSRQKCWKYYISIDLPDGSWQGLYTLILNFESGTSNRSGVESLVYRRSHFWKYVSSVRYTTTLLEGHGPIIQREHVRRIGKSKVTESFRQKFTLGIGRGNQVQLFSQSRIPVCSGTLRCACQQLENSFLQIGW